MADEQHLRGEAVKRAQSLLQKGDFAAARQAADALLADHGDDADALYLAAVAARFQTLHRDAAAYLERLHAASPEFGRAWQETGHLARDRGDASSALSAYARAVHYNPALEASWTAQADLFARQNKLARAEAARAQADRLAAMPRPLLAATHHLAEGRALKAEEFCRKFLREHPRHTEAMRLLAQIGIKLGVLDDAEFLLESATTFDPGNIQLRLDYIDVLRRRQKFAEAKAQAQWLHDSDPDNPLFQSHLAIENMQTGDYDTAFALFDAILAKLPDDPATQTSKGHALKTTGDTHGAIASYLAAIAAKPDHGDAYYALANLKTYRFADDIVDTMRAQFERPDLAFMDRVHIAFALGKAFEDSRDYAQSFRFYDVGNGLKRQQTRYDADAMQAEIDRQIEHATPELFRHHAGAGHPAPDPIFILGLPRAGSTLLEQILASHSQVDGTLELPNILALAHRLRGRKAGQSRYPAILHDLTGEQLREMGAQFIANTRIHRRGAAFFIDKMPNNFRHIALIKLILPHAKIIDARRDPMDCCFSGFKQLFAEGQEFTYGLTEIGRYYTDYVRLMDHWDTVLPGAILRVQHEDVLRDLEGQVRRMLDFVGLPFEQACVEFHTNTRAVRTASAQQVRRPINRDGVAAWKPYEKWLGPLREVLAADVHADRASA